MKKMNVFGAAAVVAVCGLAVGAHAADPDLPAVPDWQSFDYVIESGSIAAPADMQATAAGESPSQASNHQLVYSTEVRYPDKEWLRLEFGTVQLNDGAYIVVTSAKDGYYQILDATSIQQWNNTSAYFNGDRLFIDVYTVPGAAASRVDIAGVQAPVQFVEPRSQCGSWDERMPLVDNRTARHFPVGCTMWTFNNRMSAMGTAGHCAPTGGHVAQFEVPLSSSSGSWIQPPPEHQYSVDGGSIRRTNGGIGNDWCIFGVFPNSNTGLTPAERYKDTQPLAQSAPAVNGQQIRITGFGSNSTPDPVPNEWDLAQKTHTGPYVTNSGTALRYAPDTSGGNSGSPVVDDSTGRIIGVHTHAGCTTNDLNPSGNQGTSIANSNFRTAIESAQGMATGPGPGVIWSERGEDSRPERIAPAGGDTIVVLMDRDFTAQPPQANSLRMRFNDGSGYQTIAPTSVNGIRYTFTFPTADCGATAKYFFTATGANNQNFQWPLLGDAGAFEVLVSDEDELFAWDGQSNAGWTVGGNATQGQWVNGVPGTAGKGAPWVDADGSGACWTTGEDQVFDDVDGGATRLVSPTMDLSGATDPILKLEYFHYSSASSENFEIQVSDNNGGNWTTVLTDRNTRGWTEFELRIGDAVALTNQFRVRFVSQDNGSDNVVESGVDAIRVVEQFCAPTGGPCNAADFAEPFGQLSFADISGFLAAFNANDRKADLALPFGQFTFADISAFLDAFAAGCP